MPPMPVTLFMLLFLFKVVINVLSAKPLQKAAINIEVINSFRFM
jgi:hypothetical protein